MRDITLQQAVDSAVAMGPTVLMRGTPLRRPTDVVKAPSLSIDDKRTILAAWASDFYAVKSKPVRRIPNAQLVLYPDAGHGGIFQYHDAFLAKAKAFLDA
ncbi:MULTISPECIES: alpha/beta fold hydrolase [Alphaproteobacteria]|uniref:Alpha/beta hydrolase n=2 Tax=Alphaproteobacteria TaxID=28211 RepID=A0A512HMT6_9HYPH|nr:MULTISPECIES: hypothetical protein [Alphaproteobacteria]GEO86753.1 hypothetical protein RNA01_36850 [Ciceribacter naphthalenivorans]GLR20804.1 hypothetical protein GCM10007920_05880 [Ciceribacter naphthalenivorans]GLT03660.1 hypothetical protein GCM10007926_05880 [Sphingomonas psychrolutea]